MSILGYRRDTPSHNINGQINGQRPWKTLHGIALVLLLIMGAPTVWSQTTHWTIDKIVDNTTKCPGTTSGYFNPNGEFPAINGEWVVFLDEGNDGCAANNGQSIWSYNLVTKALTKLVDTGTEVPVPAGVGKFTAFVPNNTLNLQVNDGTVLFWGLDNGHNAKYPQCAGGLYTIPVNGGTIHRVVDYTMTLPGQGGYFCGLNPGPGLTGLQGMSISAGKVVFSAQADPGANDGVWWAPANVDTTEADLHLVADGSTIYDSPFPAGCNPKVSCWQIYQWGDGFIGGSTIAFTGGGGNPGPWGLFLNSIKDPILQSNYILPGDTDHDTHHPDQASAYTVPVVDGNNIFFIASDPFYLGTCGNGGSGTGTFAGVFETSLAGGTATSIMNTCDDQPNGDKLLANSFNYLAANQGTAVFQVQENLGGGQYQYVLDSSTNGVVSQLIAPGDALPSGASCNGAYHAMGCATSISPPGTGGMNGGRVVFGAEGGAYWYDDGIYVASLPCAGSVTSDVSITLGKLAYSASTGTWSQTATIKNIGNVALTAPLSLVVQDLTSGASLSNLNGTTVCFAPAGSSYINFNFSANELAIGKSAEVTLEFSAPSTAKISFISEVAGAGAR
jgi:hypothetical protein